MAYKFDPVISTYVDPKSIEISKTLNDRYAQNFAVNDALNTALRDMQYAPFENDTALAQELRKSTDAKLQQIAERGDYENMTFPLHSIAKETGNMIKPLADNYNRYQTTLTELNKRLEKTDVNPEQYDLYKSYMIRGYKGLELDEYGRPKEGTAFTAPMLYNDPKIMDRITKRLEILHTQKTGSTTSNIQQDPTTGDWVSIEQGGSVTKIEPELVQTVVDAVMQESDVKMYLDQMGTMKTYKYSDAMGGPDPLVQKQTENLQDKLGKLNTELNSGKYSGKDKAAIKASISSIEKELQTIGTLATPDQKLNYIKNSFIEEYERPIREFASLKGGIYEQTSVYKVDNLTARAKAQKAVEWAALHPEMDDTGEISAIQWGGKNINEKFANISDTAKRIAELEKTISSGTENGTPVDATVLAERRKELKTLKNDRVTIEAQIAEAARNTLTYDELRKQDPTLIDAMAEFYGTKDAGTLYLKLNQVFDNTGDQDYLNFKQKFDNKYGANAWDNHNTKYYEKTEQIFTGGQGSGERAGSAGAALAGANPVPNQKVYTSPKDVFSPKFQEKVDKGLKEVKIGGVWTVDTVPALTVEDARGFTNVFDNYFKNKPLSADKIYTDASGAELNPTDLAGYTVVGYGFPKYGADVIKLRVVKGDNKQPVTLFMDVNQITSPELQKIYNSNSYRLASRMSELGNVSKYDIKLDTVNPKTGENGTPITLRFTDTRGTGKPLVTVVGPDGSPLGSKWFIDYGLPDLSRAVNPNSELFKNFIEKPFFEVN